MNFGEFSVPRRTVRYRVSINLIDKLWVKKQFSCAIFQAKYKFGLMNELFVSKSLQLPVCTSCSRPIIANDECVKYYCPNCGYVLIWRCQSCRQFARSYKCIGCGFEGP